LANERRVAERLTLPVSLYALLERLKVTFLRQV